MSEYDALRYRINDIAAGLPTKYFTTYEVGYFEENDKIQYAIFEKDTNNMICQTGESQGVAMLLTELINGISLIDFSLKFTGLLDAHYDLNIETDAESLPISSKNV